MVDKNENTTTEKKPKIQHQAVGRKDLYMIAIDDIHLEEGWNSRHDTQEYRDGIRQLADSIKSEWIKQPITVYLRKPNNDIVATDGHRRLAAARLAISEGTEPSPIKCLVEDRASNEADRVLSQITRNSGVPLTMSERAQVVKRLDAFGWSQKEIATRTAFTIPHIASLMTLSAAPVAVHDMINSGQVSASLATDMLKEHGEDKAVEVLGSAIESAAKVGKKRATRKNLDKPKTVKWSEVGPEAIQVLEDVKRLCSFSDDSNLAKLIDEVIEKGKEC